jgi:hypothetical protein
MATKSNKQVAPCGDCGRTQGHEPGCYAGGGDPDAIRDLLRGPLGKRCRIESGPDGRRVSIYLTEDEWQAARRLPSGERRVREPEALWSIRCFQCHNNAFHTTPDRSVAIAWRGVHRVNCPGHDVRLICIPRD